MIRAAWSRLGIGPASFVLVGLATIALLLSRGAGNGWLVVVAAALLGVFVVGAVIGAIGLVGARVTLEAPSDATVGDVISIGVQVSARLRQLRTLTLRVLDHSTHPVDGATRAVIRVRAERRGLYPSIPIEVRGGLPLGLMRPSLRLDMALPEPLAVAPVPAVVSLIEALGEDLDAEVRSVRGYQPGDAPRLVHWRSTARRGELMVRELESSQLLRGTRLQLRIRMSGDDRAEETASQACGLAFAALDVGMRVDLLTCEADGPRAGAVSTRREVGRRLAAAIAGEPPSADTGDPFGHVLNLA